MTAPVLAQTRQSPVLRGTAMASEEPVQVDETSNPPLEIRLGRPRETAGSGLRGSIANNPQSTEIRRNLITHTQQEASDDLRGAIAGAVASSPKLGAVRMDAKAAETGISRQWTGYLPVITLGAGINRGNLTTMNVPNFGEQIRRSASVNLSMPLFNGGQTYYGIRSAQSQAQSAHAEVKATQSDVALEVAAAYLQYLLAERTVALLEANVQRMKQLLVSMQKRREAGFSSDADVLQVDAELAAIQQQVAESRILSGRSKASVESLVGRKVRFVNRLPRIESFLAPDENSMADLAMRNNPRVNAARHTASASDYASRAAFGRLLPQVDFNARAERAYDYFPGTRPKNWQVGLQLTAPIVDAGLVMDYRQRRESALAVQLRADEASRSAQEQTRGFWREYRGGAARVAAASRRAKDYGRVVQSQEKLFEAGLNSIDALLEKYRLWNAAEVQREQVTMQRYITLCQLLAATGRFDLAMLGY